VLVFGRFGRPEAEGAFATCHCLTLPETEPGYYSERIARTGELTADRVVRHQDPRSGSARPDQVPDLVRLAAVLRAVARAIVEGRALRAAAEDAPLGRQARHHQSTSSITSIRRRRAAQFRARRRHPQQRTHAPEFYGGRRGDDAAVPRVEPGSRLTDFLRWDFDGLQKRFGGVTATTSGTSRPSRSAIMEPCTALPVESAEGVKVEPLKRPIQPALYTESDLHVRQFTDAPPGGWSENPSRSQQTA